jgi:hypothetical protein
MRAVLDLQEAVLGQSRAKGPNLTQRSRLNDCITLIILECTLEEVVFSMIVFMPKLLDLSGYLFFSIIRKYLHLHLHLSIVIERHHPHPHSSAHLYGHQL